MSYSSLTDSIHDLDQTGQLFRIPVELDPNLEIPALQRLVYERNGPALYFSRVKGSPFPAVSNLYGSKSRVEFLFRHSLKQIQTIFKIKAHPPQAFKSPLSSLLALPVLTKSLPLPFSGPVLKHETTLDQLPQIKSWPKDGGAFITLPQVYSENPLKPSVFSSNLGMYRIQISGNEYQPNHEVGLHYQLHRGLGIHHNIALQNHKSLKVSIFVGGPPAHALAAVMPLPEFVPEVVFAGLLGNRSFRYSRWQGHLISSDADFCIVGEVDLERTLPEGPFGDHLGYYSLTHPNPVLKVKKVFHRPGAVWPFTVVGRPPQEDTQFGEFIHSLTGPLLPTEVPGIKEVHAVDAAGVHPLLLVIGRESYVPFAKRKPRELHTLAHALLGFNQISLAKYLFLCAGEDNPQLTTHHISEYFQHILTRFQPRTDLHFMTKTTIDTLDYTGHGHNEGSKVVWLAAGEEKRTLGTRVPSELKLPPSFSLPQLAIPGVLVLTCTPHTSYGESAEIQALLQSLENQTCLDGFPLIVIADDSQFTAKTLNNFLWVTFTRSDPAQDIYGVKSFIEFKHWGCEGPVIIDARIKKHHAPPLEDDPTVISKLESLAARGGPLFGLI